MRGQNRSGCGNTRDEVSRESLSGCHPLGWAYRLSRNELLTDTRRAASLPGTRAQGCRGTSRELWGFSRGGAQKEQDLCWVKDSGHCREEEWKLSEVLSKLILALGG